MHYLRYLLRHPSYVWYPGTQSDPRYCDSWQSKGGDAWHPTAAYYAWKAKSRQDLFYHYNGKILKGQTNMGLLNSGPERSGVVPWQM
jgi:hypothetical protein